MPCQHVKKHMLKATGFLLATAISALGQNFPTVINTAAGGGSSDNIPATSSPVSPASVLADGAGNLFIADRINQRIRKVDTNGIITTVAGNGAASFSGDGGSATNASLNSPTGVAIDSAGNLFIADFANNRIRKVTTSGIITTVAGNGTNVFSGDGGPATSASLNSPIGVAVDGAGNLFVADEGNRRIRKVDTSGIITTVAGNGNFAFSGDGGLATIAGMEPAWVAVDGAGNFFIADFTNNRIRKVDATGIINTVAGNGTAAFSGDGGPATSASLWTPRGVAVDGVGNLFIADSNNFRIRKVDHATQIISTIAGNGSFNFSGDGGPATSAGLNPNGAVVDSAGNLFIADLGGPSPGDNRVRKVDHATQIITTVAGNGNPSFLGDNGPATKASLRTPQGVAQDAAGNLFLADTSNNRIRKVDSTGVITTVAGSDALGFSGDGGPATSASLSSPTAVAADSTGNLLIADTQNQRIRKVDAGGTITTVAGNGTAAFSGDGGLATSASLNFPTGIAVDSAGNLFISDTSNNRIRKVDTGGTITTVAGNGTLGFSGDGGPATSSSLAGPDSTFLDGAGNLFIADTSNQRVRKVDHATQVISTVAGNGTAGFSGDGGPATSASLANPFAVGFDGAGNLYIADFGNNRIRKVAANGTITTIAGNGNPGFSGDGGSAASASLNSPAGLAVDSVGNFFIADSNNSRIRKVVTPPDFAIAASPSSASVRAGQSATFTFTVTPGGGFANAVAFACSGLPTLSSCTFTPASVTPNGNPVTVTLVVKTTGPNASRQTPPLPGRRQKQQPLLAFWTFSGAIGLMGLVLAGASGEKKRGGRGRSSTVALLGAVLLVVALVMLGCGGGHSAPTQTPTGTSTVVVTASSGSTSHAANVTLMITQ